MNFTQPLLSKSVAVWTISRFLAQTFRDKKVRAAKDLGKNFEVGWRPVYAESSIAQEIP